MRLFERLRRWRDAYIERQIEKMTARAADLSEDLTYSVVDLHNRGVIRARATGQSISRIDGEIQNLIRKKLRVAIEPGTYFVASGHHQNMATTDRYEFLLDPRASRCVSISAACINASLPVPHSKSRFRGVRKLPDDVLRSLTAARGSDAMTIQAGVWTLTDSYSASDIQSHLVTRDRNGRLHQTVSDDNIAQARRILDNLGIRHRL